MKVEMITDSYQVAIDKLKEQGFVKYVDNGAQGLNGNVFTTTMVKAQLVATIIHFVKTDATYLVYEEDANLSKRLFDSEEYIAENKSEAKTTLHMLETYRPGSSFVLQLKNGHFILCDGSWPEELPYLIEYMEQFVPEGEVPVIEAWFITHPHSDHVSIFQEFNSEKGYEKRLYVEGIYFDAFDDELAESMHFAALQDGVRNAAKVLRTPEGNITPVYRPHAGERYYFSDITVDVMQTSVQVPREKWYKWKNNLNEMSTWYMFTIEGQKYLNSGDADLGAMREIMKTYDQKYLDMDIMAVQHHGINVHDEFTDFIKVKTLLYPYFGVFGVFKEGLDWLGSWQASVSRNKYLHTTAEEFMSYGDGTKILCFPYSVGEAKTLPLRGERFEFEGLVKERRIDYGLGGVFSE